MSHIVQAVDCANTKRELTSVLAPLEKATLVWMARRMPACVNSDHLTLLGAVAMALAGASYAASRWRPEAILLVIPCLALNWFGDSLDGTLARVRDCQRPRYGFYVDHVLDALGILFVLGGLAASGYMSPLSAALVLIAYFLLSIEICLATHALGVFRMSFWKMGPTELRLVLAFGNLVAFVHPTATIAGRTFLLFDVGGAVAAVGLLTTFVVSAVRNTRALYRLEPLERA